MVSIAGRHNDVVLRGPIWAATVDCCRQCTGPQKKRFSVSRQAYAGRTQRSTLSPATQFYAVFGTYHQQTKHAFPHLPLSFSSGNPPREAYLQYWERPTFARAPQYLVGRSRGGQSSGSPVGCEQAVVRKTGASAVEQRSAV